MIVDYEKEKDSLFGWFLDVSLKSFETVEVSNLDVKFTINDKEIPIKDLILFLENQIKALIKKEAVKLLENELSEFKDLVGALSDEIIIKAFETLNIDLEDFTDESQTDDST